MDTDWLNPALDIDALRERYRAHQRIVIPQSLRLDRAVGVHAALSSKMSWALGFMADGKPESMTAVEWDALPEGQKAEFHSKINATAGHEFQYVFWYSSVSDAIARGEILDPQIHTLHRFLTSEPFIAFIKSVTGNDDGHWVNVHAARYSRNHFLNKHNDSHDPRRRIAYVLNMTRIWRPDWGGTLHFMEQDGNVTETVTPKFNTLTLFTVPALHYVAPVAPYAIADRYSITGWLHAGPKPGTNIRSP